MSRLWWLNPAALIIHALDHLECRVGFRGARLVMFGTIWCLVGIQLLVEPMPARPSDALIFHEQIPGTIRATLWLATGAYALAAGWWSRRLPRMLSQAAAWSCLLVMPSLRFFSWLGSWLAWLISWAVPWWPTRGYESGLGGAFIYLIIIAVVLSSSRHTCPRTELPVIPPPPDTMSGDTHE